MLYTHLEVKFARTVNHDEFDYTIEATSAGLTIELPHEYIKFPSTIEEIRDTLQHDAEMYLFDTLTYTLYAKVDERDNITAYAGSLSFDEIIDLRKSAEQQDKKVFEQTGSSSDEWDGGYDWCREICVRWAITSILAPLVKKLEISIKKHKLLEEIKEKECPVLMTPLKLGDAAKFDKCNHLISRTALTQLKVQDGLISCPLCRCEHSRWQTTLV